MKLNLHIILDDLCDVILKSNIQENYFVRKLRFPVLFEKSSKYQNDRLYIATDEQLSALQQNEISTNLNIICIGLPHEPLSTVLCNALWVTQDITPNALLIRVSEIFDKYNRWETSLLDALSEDKDLRTLGELSTTIFRKPMWLWDSHFQTIFNIADETCCDIPSGYLKHDDYTPWPPWEVNLWSSHVEDYNFGTLLSSKEPYFLKGAPGVFEYNSLCYNLFVEETRVATVTLDSDCEHFSGHDYALLKVFGDIALRGFKNEAAFNLSMTKRFEDQINLLLGNNSVFKPELTKGLEALGWNPNGAFMRFVAAPYHVQYSDKMLQIAAEYICTNLPYLIYTIYEHSITFIANVKNEGGDTRGIVKTVLDVFRSNQFEAKIGASAAFYDFSDLYYYYRQAVKALSLGERTCPEKKHYYFEDYMLTYILDQLQENSHPETLCPSGLISLIRHDRENGTDFVKILRVYLRNNCNIAKTSEDLFMHRNTLLYRLNKIKEMLRLDLDDSDVRLLLQISIELFEED